MLQLQSVDAELSRLAALAQVAPAMPPQRLTPSQLAVLATGLGRKHGVKVVFGGNGTASTDGQTVVMPLTSKENSWIVRGYLDHEVGHVRLTNLNTIPKESPLHKSLWNILEDVRIERAMSNLYPGMSTNLRVLISQLRKTKAGVFELDPDAPPEAVISAYIGLMLRSLYLGQPEVADLALKTREQFLKTFGSELERDLFALISDIETTASTEDVVSLVDRIVDLLKQRAKEKPPEPEQPQDQPQESLQDAPEGPQGEPEPDMPGEDKGRENGDMGQPDSSESDGGDGQDGEADQGQGEQDEPSEDSGDSSEQEDGQPGDQGQQETDGSGSSSSGDDGDDTDSQAADTPVAVSTPDGAPADPVREAIIQALESQEEQADLGEQLRDLVSQREEILGHGPYSVNIAVPAPTDKLKLSGYQKLPVCPATSVVAKLSARLRGLLQAQALDNAKPSAAGSRIARSRLHRIRTGEPKLFLRKETVRQVNTAIHLLVDNSGSMRCGQRFEIARDVTLALVKALGNFRGMNLAVTLFPGLTNSDPSPPSGPHTPVAPVLAHGQRPDSKILWAPSARGGTPVAASLRYVLATMLALTEPRKIVVILTDGDPQDRLGAIEAIKEAADLKIEVVTLGIEDVRYPELFPHFEIVKDVKELPEKTFKLLERLLIT